MFTSFCLSLAVGRVQIKTGLVAWISMTNRKSLKQRATYVNAFV